MKLTMTPLKSQLTFGTHFMALGHWMNGVAVVDCCGAKFDDDGGDDDGGGDAAGEEDDEPNKLSNDGASFCFSGLLSLGTFTGRLSGYWLLLLASSSGKTKSDSELEES